MGLKIEIDLPDDLAAHLERIAKRDMRTLHDLIAKELHHFVFGHWPVGQRATEEEVAAFRLRREKSPRITLSAKQRNQIYERCEGKCAYCEGTILFNEVFHIDHIHPISKGGTNDDSNLTLSCVACNVRKRDKLVAVK
jgi:hypothetical protein